MSTVNIIGKASKIVEVDRVNGLVQFTFRTTSMEDAVKTYNNLVKSIKDNIDLVDPDDEYFKVTLGSLTILNSTEQIRKLFKKYIENSIYTRAAINFDTSKDNKILGALIAVCEKFSNGYKDTKLGWKQDSIDVVYKLIQNSYLSDKTSEQVKKELLADAVRDGYERMQSILSGIATYTNTKIDGVSLAKQYLGIKLVDISVPNTQNNYYKSANMLRASSAALDSTMEFMEETTNNFELADLGENKVTLNIELSMVFEIEY